MIERSEEVSRCQRLGPLREERRGVHFPSFLVFEREHAWRCATGGARKRTDRREGTRVGARQSDETKRSIGIYTCIYVCTRYAYGRDRCGPRRYENERYIGTQVGRQVGWQTIESVQGCTVSRVTRRYMTMPIEIPVVTRKRAALLVGIARRKIVQSVAVVPRFSQRGTRTSSRRKFYYKGSLQASRDGNRYAYATNPIFLKTAASSSYFLGEEEFE